MTNQQTNIQSYNIDIHAFKLRKVFDNYGIVTSYPIDRHQFILDVLQSCISDTTKVFDSEGSLIN